MKLQKFIDILDKSDDKIVNYFKKYGKNIFNNNEFLYALIKEKWSQQKWYKLITLKWIIFTDLRRKHDKEKNCFDNMLPIYCYFADYMSVGCTFFGKMRVPFEKWEDLAKEQVDILKILVEKNQLKSFRRTNLKREFRKKYRKRLQYFLDKGFIDPIYIEDPMGL